MGDPSIKRNFTRKSATVLSGQTESDEVFLQGFAIFGLIVPSNFDGTTITFKVSDAASGSYVALKDRNNTQVSMTIAGSAGYDLPTELAPWTHLKIVCGTAQSVSNTIFTVVMKG